jgi:hypothetical protein
MLLVSNYKLRSKSVAEPNQPDQPIGSFPNREAALVALNRSIVGDGKESGAAQLTIGSFAFEDAGLNMFCSVEYYLAESLNGSEALHRLFPRDHLQFNPMKTSNAKRSFCASV